MKPKLTKCPTCGSKVLKLARSDFTFEVRKRVSVVPKLERYVCRNCGEVLFDYAGVKRLEKARSRGRRLSRTA